MSSSPVPVRLTPHDRALLPRSIFIFDDCPALDDCNRRRTARAWHRSAAWPASYSAWPELPCATPKAAPDAATLLAVALVAVLAAVAAAALVAITRGGLSASTSATELR